VELIPTDEAHVVARVDVDDVGHVAGIVARCRRLFDLDADPLAVDETLGADPRLAPSVRRHPGLRVPGAVDGFELLVRAVLGQQVSVAAARTFAGRLVQRCGRPLATPRGSLTAAFPDAAAVADADLDGLGLTGARTRTLRAVAETVAAGRLVIDPVADRGEVRARLLELPGIGAWTADYVAMRALGDPDAFPSTDLVLRRALDGDDPTRPDRWRPWRAYAAMHLWLQA
jgi:AraC family transcriptional regulator, regulatory protein of adaptative response / DNA-3-methyladenine glycosylase II